MSGRAAFVRFVDHLSRLRNTLVHDVRNTSFDLKHHVASLAEAHFREFVDAFGTTAEFPRSVRASIRGCQEQLIRVTPRETILTAIDFWLAHLHLGLQHELFKRIAAALERIERGR